MGFFNAFLPPFIHRQHKKKSQPIKPSVLIKPASSLPKNLPWLQPKIDVERKPVPSDLSLPKGIVSTPESPLINIAIIPKHLFSHPNAVHFDKGEVLPHHRLIGSKPSTWTPELKPKQPRTLIGGNPATWSPQKYQPYAPTDKESREMAKRGMAV